MGFELLRLRDGRVFRSLRLCFIFMLLLGTVGTGGAPQQAVTPIDGGPVSALPNWSPEVVSSEPGKQTDPHVDGILATYTSFQFPEGSVGFYDFTSSVGSTIPHGIPGESYTASDVSGSQISFASLFNGLKTCWVHDVLAFTYVEIAPQAGLTCSATAIGSNTVAVVDEAVGNGDIRVADVRTPSATPINLSASPNIDRNPSVSPAGTAVVWESCDGALVTCAVMKSLFDGTTWAAAQVVSNASLELNADTDGLTIVYQSDRPSATGPDIYWQPLGGGPERQLALPGIQQHPSIREGIISFESRTSASAPGDVFVYVIATNTLYRVTNTPAVDESLSDIAVLPNGDVRVVYAWDDGAPDPFGPDIVSSTFTIVNDSDADVAVTVTAVAVAVAGETLTYRLTVTNQGPATARGVAFTMPPVTGLLIARAESPAAFCVLQNVIPGVGALGPVECDAGTLAPGDSVVITIDAIPQIIGEPVVTFSVSAIERDPVPSNNIAEIAVRFVDTTLPSISCTPPLVSGWVGANVTVPCTATDGGSGLANSADASFMLSTSVEINTELAAAGTNSRSICDVAGNCAPAGPYGPYMVDRRPPSIFVRAPATGAVFRVGDVVAADYWCEDGFGSGVTSCTGSVPVGSPLDTATAGTKTLTVSASDTVGNPSSVSVNYGVVVPSTIVLDSQPSPSVVGSPVTLTATVTGTAPTGTVTFYADGFPVAGSWPLQGTSPTTATASTSAFLAAGSHSLHASYSGDSRNAASMSPQVPHQVNAEDESSGTATKAMATNLTHDLKGGFGQPSEASVGSTGPFATVRSNLVAFGGLNFIGGHVGLGPMSQHGDIAGMRGVAYGTYTNTTNEPLLQARADVSGEFLGNAGLVISTVYVFDANMFLSTIRSSGQTLPEFLLGTPVDTPGNYLAAGQPALSLARLFPQDALLASASRVFTATSYTNGTSIRLEATLPAAPGQSVIYVSDFIAYNGSAGTLVSVGQRLDFGKAQIAYTMSTSPSSLALLTSSSKSSTLRLRSDNGVSEPVQLSTAWVGAQPAGVTATVSPGNVTVPASATSSAAATVSINASASASPGTFTLRVTGTSATGVKQLVDLPVLVSATALTAPTCACTKTGPFQDPRVRGLVPQSPFATVEVSGDRRTLKRPDGEAVLEVNNVSAHGFSPNGKYLVLITKQSTLTGPDVFSLTLYSVPTGRVLGPGSPLQTHALSWGFSPDDDNRYFLVASSASLPTHVNVNIYDTHTGAPAIRDGIVVTAYSSWGQPPEWTDKAHVPNHDGHVNGNDKVGGWGFSPDGHTFVLSYKTNSTYYLLSLYNLRTGSPLVNSGVNNDVASFWQFSPCGELFMWVHQQGANPSTSDEVTFTFTSNGQPYPEGGLTLEPSAGNPSATVVAGSNGGRDIQLTGMSKASIPSPPCVTSAGVESPANIALTDAAGRTTGFDPLTGGVVNAIPGGAYTGVGTEPQTITVPYAPGAYLLIAYGLDSLTSPEPYTLIFATIDASGDVVDRTRLSGMAFRGSVHGFAFSTGDGPITPVPTEPADTTPPAITCAVSDGQWHASDVVLACTASDSQSGLANAGDASFSLSTHVAVGTETGNASTDTRQVCDNAGNCATAGPVTGNKVDKKAPSIATVAPAGEYLVGQVVAANYSCSDAGSGVASCLGTVANGASIDTASEGTKSFTITAIDVVGNKTDVQTTYRVVAAPKYTFVGFFQPIDMSSPDLIVRNTVKAGQTVPVKWLLTQDGTPVSDPASFLGLSSYEVSCSSGAGSIDEAIEETASGSSGLQYNGGGNWQYNWKTLQSYKRNTCRVVVVRFSDGTVSPSAHFKFK